MSDVSTWDTNANNNNSPPPDGFPEGQTPGSLNDCSREVMAAIARWRDGFYVYGNASIDGVLTVGTSGNAQVTTQATATQGVMGTSGNFPMEMRSNNTVAVFADTLQNIGFGTTALNTLASGRTTTLKAGSSGGKHVITDAADAGKVELTWDQSGLAGYVGTVLNDQFQVLQSNTARITLDTAGNVIMPLPSTDPSVANALWNNSGVVNISSG